MPMYFSYKSDMNTNYVIATIEKKKNNTCNASVDEKTQRK